MNQVVESYLADLTRALNQAEPGERADIVEQIRDHIDARIGQLGHDPAEAEINAILAELGDPQLVAAAWEFPDAVASRVDPSPLAVGEPGQGDVTADAAYLPNAQAGAGASAWERGQATASGHLPVRADGDMPQAGALPSDPAAPGAAAGSAPGASAVVMIDPLRPQRQRAGLLIALGAIALLISPLPFIGLVASGGVLIAAIVAYRRAKGAPEVTNLLWIAIALAGLGVLVALLVTLGLSAWFEVSESVSGISSVSG